MNLGFDGFELPAPADWQKFERLCRDLWAEIWQDPNTQLNGRSGQEQAGIDIVGKPTGADAYSGIQCKRKGNIADAAEISEGELRAEVAKAINFRPPLKGEFILAFTGKRDAKIQTVARTITEELAATAGFRVVVCSWEDIQDRLGQHVQVVLQHYSGIAAAFKAIQDRVLPEPMPPSTDLPAHDAQAKRTRSVVFSDDVPQLDAEHRAEIEMVRTALKDGHAGVALQQAEALRARIWASASEASRARLLILVAHAHLAVGDDAVASRLLVAAAGHAPTDKQVQAQVSLGHSLLGNDAAAATWANRALAQDPTNLTAVQVAALHDQRTDAEVLAFHEPVVGKCGVLYSILGHRALARGETKRAREWFERALELDADRADISAVTAQAIIDSVTADLTGRFPTGAQARADLERAVNLLTTSISHLKDDATRKAQYRWFVSRLVAQRLLSSPDLLASADDALAACGPRAELVRLRAAIASDAGDHSTVVRLIRSLPEPREFDDIGLLAVALGELGELRRSTELWEELLTRAGLPDHIRHEAHRNHAISLLLDGRTQDARTAVERELVDGPGTLSPTLVAIAVAERLGETGERDAYLNTAVAAAANAAPLLCLELGDALMRAERWQDAAEIYSKAVADGSGDLYGRRRLQALYKAGKLESALRLCDEVDATNGISRFAAEMRSSIYEILGDLERATQACRDFLAVEPANPVLGLRLALVLQRRGALAESKLALAKIDATEVNDLESASILAQMLVRIGEPQQGLEVAYRMRRQHLRAVEAHLKYVSIYTLARGLDDVESEETVAPDSAVQLAGPGAPGWILVGASDDADLNQKEYSRGHPLAEDLLGKRVGDSVSLQGAAASWTITAIGTKYGFAFGRTLELFPAHFPTNSEIEQHEIPEDAGKFVDQLKERLQQGNPRRQAALNQYAEGRCTVGSVATVLGQTTWQAIGLLLYSPGGLVCSANSVEERSSSALALTPCEKPLLLDLTAISALDTAGVLRDGTLAGRQLCIAQRTLDEVAAEHFRWQTTSSGGSMSLGVEDGTLVRHDTTAEEVARLREHFGELLGWLRAHVRVAPVPAEVAERYAKQDRFGDFIGDSSWDTIRIAANPGVVMVSDDLWLRQLAKHTTGASGLCSAALLVAELQAGRLDRDRYCDAIVQLIASGFRNLPIDGAILEAAARADQWRHGPVLSKVLNGLRGPDVEERSAVAVGADFIRRIWLNVVLSQQRMMLLLPVLDALVAGRNTSETLRRVHLQIGRALALLPFAREEVVKVIVGWKAMGIIRVGR